MHRITSRRVQIGPPSDDDLQWIMNALADPEIAHALGWKDGVGAEVYGGYIEGTVLLLPYRNRDRERAGFVMLMRNDIASRTWSVNVVVPDRERRNGFTTLAACDAVCELVFDVRGDERLVWLIEPTNGASRVLPKRLGYSKLDEVVRDGTTYHRYGIGAESWHVRRARLGADYEVARVALEDVGHGRIIAAVRSAS